MSGKDNRDLAGRAYWDQCWEGRDIPDPVDPDRPGLDFYVDRRIHAYLAEAFRDLAPRERLLEAGCARSQFLPYFALTHGFQVEGLDYSPEGCRQTEAVLAKAGVQGTMHQRDLFADPGPLAGRYDAVVSFGLVEHFSDTGAVFAALASMLRPGGLLITMVPNMRRLPGLLTRLVNRHVYDAHKRLVPDDLHRAGQAAGLDTVRCGYFLTLNLSALSMAVQMRPPAWWSNPLLRAFSAASKLVWLAEGAGLPTMPNAVTSPFIMHTARAKSK